MVMRQSPERYAFGTWLRFTGWDEACRNMTFDEVKFLGEVHWKPQTIISHRNEDARAKGVVYMAPRPKINGYTEDDLLRSCWPTPGEDRIRIKQRLFQILAIQRYPGEFPNDMVYEVFIA